MTIITLSFLNMEILREKSTLTGGESRVLFSDCELSSRPPSEDAEEAVGNVSLELSGEVKAYMKI